MPGLDGPVCLTRSAPAEVYAGGLMFYDVVPPDVVSRSGVLASIVEAGGDARLPDAVTLSEFKAWSNTITDSHDHSKSDDIDHACSVLKVADALDDRHFSDWLQLTAAAIRQVVVRRGHQQPNEAIDTSGPVFKLPDHLQHCLIQAVLLSGTIGRGRNLAGLLKAWSSHHHAAVIAAAITPEKTLFAPSSQLHAVVRAASLLPSSPPSLLSLRLQGLVPFEHFDTPARIEVITGVAAALRQQASLTHLSIASAYNAAPIAQAIASLTALRALRLCGERCQIAAAVVPHLKMILDSLPSLQDFSVIFAARVPCAADLLPSKRNLEGEAAPREELKHYLASLLAGATALTSLEILQQQGHRNFVASSPLSLPCLKQLDVSSTCHCIATALPSHLSAPLARLKVKHLLTQRRPLQLDDLLHAQPLWTSLSKFGHLRSIDIDLKVHARTEDELNALRAGPVAAIVSLTSLHELSISSSLPMLLCATQQLADRGSPLQRLVLNRSSVRTFDQETAELPAAWGELLSHLSRLRLLHLGVQCGRSSISAAPQPNTSGLAALQPMTQLTALHLQGWSFLRDARDHEALAGLQQLRSLCVSDYNVPYNDEAAHVRTFGALASLTELALQPGHGAACFLEAFVRQEKAALVSMWSALQKLALPATSGAGAERTIRAAAAFPALQELRLTVDECLRSHALDQLSWPGLEALASDCGVRLAVKRVWPGLT